MELKDLETALRTLALLAECEEAVAAFYRRCAESWPEERALWGVMAEEELGHARNLRAMRARAEGRAQDFTAGKIFSPFAVRTMIDGLRHQTIQVASGRIARTAALAISRDLEQSLIEKRYGDVLHTSDREYNALLREITEQTTIHAARIVTRAAGLPVAASYAM